MVSTKQMPPKREEKTQKTFPWAQISSSMEPPAILFIPESPTPFSIRSPLCETQPVQSHRSSVQGWQFLRGRTSKTF